MTIGPSTPSIPTTPGRSRYGWRGPAHSSWRRRTRSRAVGAPDRLRDKDALDVLRLLRAVDTSLLVDRLTALADDELSAPVTVEARAQLERLFSTAASEGAMMAARAAGPSEDPATIATSLAALVNDLLEGL